MFSFLSTHATITLPRRAGFREVVRIAIRILQIIIYAVGDGILVNDQYCKLLENTIKFFNRLRGFPYFNITLSYFLHFKEILSQLCPYWGRGEMDSTHRIGSLHGKQMLLLQSLIFEKIRIFFLNTASLPLQSTQIFLYKSQNRIL